MDILPWIGPAASAIAAVSAVVAAVHSLQNKAAIQSVKIEIDGRMSEFIALTKKSSLAEGVLQEKDRQRLEPET
jgi:hypothetical protein